jgi:hypothetical protein
MRTTVKKLRTILLRISGDLRQKTRRIANMDKNIAAKDIFPGQFKASIASLLSARAKAVDKDRLVKNMPIIATKKDI